MLLFGSLEAGDRINWPFTPRGAYFFENACNGRSLAWACQKAVSVPSRWVYVLCVCHWRPVGLHAHVPLVSRSVSGAWTDHCFSVPFCWFWQKKTGLENLKLKIIHAVWTVKKAKEPHQLRGVLVCRRTIRMHRTAHHACQRCQKTAVWVVISWVLGLICGVKPLRGAWRDHCFNETFSWFLHKAGPSQSKNHLCTLFFIDMSKERRAKEIEQRLFRGVLGHRHTAANDRTIFHACQRSWITALFAIF